VARSKQTGVAGSVKIRPQRRLTQAELDIFLERAADLLRGGVDHSEFRGSRVIKLLRRANYRAKANE